MRRLALLSTIAALATPAVALAASTTTAITADTPDPSLVGAPVTVSYAVGGGGSPTGDVTVSDGVDSCTGTVAAGQCSITLTTAGSRTLVASYEGDESNDGSTSAGEPHEVNTRPVIAVLTGGGCANTMATTVRLSVTDPDGDAVSVSVLPNPVAPVASLALGGAGPTRTLSVTAHSAGTIAFLLLGSDGRGGSAQRAITVRVGANGGETVDGGAGTDVIFGVNGADILNGNGGADYICSGNGAGTTSGGDGDDTLDGQNASDVLQGGAGDDVIAGGNGSDAFSGGIGEDTFLDFARADTTDGS